MTTLVLSAPLSGWCLALADVPDPVFSEGLAGDGVAIDPTSAVLCAPCDGIVMPAGHLLHALSLDVPGFGKLLLHVGIETVRLRNVGFERLVSAGQMVERGTPLLRFDLDQVARGARSLITPVLAAEGARVVSRMTGRKVAQGQPFMEIEPVPEGAVTGKTVGSAGGRAADPAGTKPETVNSVVHFEVAFDDGLHARPAAQIVAVLSRFTCRVEFGLAGKRADARSPIGLLALGATRGAIIEVAAEGGDATEALEALAQLGGLARRALSADALSRPAQGPVPVSCPPGKRAATVASPGLAAGTAYQFQRDVIELAEEGGGPDAESARLREAVARVSARLMADRDAAEGTAREVLGAHQALLADPSLLSEAERQIARGKSAGFAWRLSVGQAVAAIEALRNRHLAERAADLRDLERQVLEELTGVAAAANAALPDMAVVIADDLSPSEFLKLDRGRLAALVLAHGGATAHVALLAAARGLPALVAAGEEVLAIANGTALVVDAEAGVLEVAPDPDRWRAVPDELTRRREDAGHARAAAATPALTRDGVRIWVEANIGGEADARAAVAAGADGVGLYRTEFLFLDRDRAPDAAEQQRAYQAAADILAGRPLTLRTLDMGGDKPIPYLPLPPEENPALGLRGLRTSLFDPALLTEQLTAMVRVHGTPLRILLPMVTDVSDVRVVRAMLANLSRAGDAPQLGVMIETPASAILADSLLAEVDFLSVGTNDLSQYALAMDRGHPQLAGRLDALHPAVLRLIGMAADAGRRAGKPVAVCGALASNPLAVPVLIGAGITELSCVPALIPRIKAVVRQQRLSTCVELAARAVRAATAAEVHELVRQYVQVAHVQEVPVP